jgi:hypothetical protein
MKRSIKWVGFALIVGLLPTLHGCATILRGTNHGIGISTQPPGAEVTIDNEIYGITPVSAKLKRKDNHHIVIQMAGYEPYEIMLTRQTSGWVFGNILFGPGVLIGLAVDAISGGMYTLSPDQVSADLPVSKSQAALEEGTLVVVLVPRADPSWRKVGQMTRTVTGELDENN